MRDEIDTKEERELRRLEKEVSLVASSETPQGFRGHKLLYTLPRFTCHSCRRTLPASRCMEIEFDGHLCCNECAPTSDHN